MYARLDQSKIGICYNRLKFAFYRCKGSLKKRKALFGCEKSTTVKSFTVLTVRPKNLVQTSFVYFNGIY